MGRFRRFLFQLRKRAARIERHPYGASGQIIEYFGRPFLLMQSSRLVDIEFGDGHGRIFSIAEHWLPRGLLLERVESTVEGMSPAHGIALVTRGTVSYALTDIDIVVLPAPSAGVSDDAEGAGTQRLCVSTRPVPFWGPGAMFSLAHEIGHEMVRRRSSKLAWMRSGRRRSRFMAAPLSGWSRFISRRRGIHTPSDARNYLTHVLQQERDAWAVALLLLRSARAAGHDPEPDMQDRLRLLERMHISLASYEHFYLRWCGAQAEQKRLADLLALQKTHARGAELFEVQDIRDAATKAFVRNSVVPRRLLRERK